MRKFSISLLFVSVAFVVFSCLSENGKDRNAIEKQETAFKQKHDSANLAVQLDKSYQIFIRKYPSDTSLPRILFEDAQLNIYPLKRTETALNQLEELYTKYPDSKYSANAMFKAAFLNENVMGRTQTAKSLYLQFIKTYPDNPLVSDAKLSVENIGMSPAEQLKKIRARQDSLIKDNIIQK